jgi:hypothetical protein
MVYLDPPAWPKPLRRGEGPPFNSNADYNVLFREASGEASPAQFHAFTDTWNWADALEQAAQKILRSQDKTNVKVGVQR